MTDSSSPISTSSSNPLSSSTSSSSATAATAASPAHPQSQQPPIQPLRNPKYRHISRSAAKRESVQLLGSIKDLQLHFSRAGLVEHRPGTGVGVKSTGTGAALDGPGSGLGSLGEEEEIENRPPSSSSISISSNIRTRERKPFKDVELPRVDLEDARREARGIVGDVRGIWGLSVPVAPPSPGSASASASASATASATTSALPSSKSLYFPTNFQDLLHDGPSSYQEYRNSEDVHTALVNTARSIRRIRFLALSISHGGSASTGRKASGSLLPPRLGGAGKLRSSLSTPSRPAGPPRAVSGGYATERKSSLGRSEVAGNQDEDILGDLRKAALDVLAALRALEERLRVIRDNDNDEGEDEGSALSRRSPTPTPMAEDDDPNLSASSSDQGIDIAQSSSASCNADSGSTSMVFSEPEGYYDSDEDDLFNVNALAQNQADNHNHNTTTWEERIVSERREYRVLDDNEWEREARATREGVGKWVAVVERMFVFAVHGEGEDGKGLGVGVEELEDWAKEGPGDGEGQDDGLARIQSFLLSHLPLDLALRLPAPNSENFPARFLSALSDGYILIHAYNASLLRSSKPWGFIPDEDVHDTLSSAPSAAATESGAGSGGDEGGKKDKEWTFRRVGNLTCWGAALRHRYQLPLSIASSSTTASPFLPLPSSSSNSTSTSGASTPSRPQPNSRPRPSIDTQSLSTRSISGSGSARNREEIDFDPMMIAKRSPGWEGMLSSVVGRWVKEVGREIRESRGIRAKSAPTSGDDRDKGEREGEGDVRRGGLF
ncbi:hypothetical protein IAT40_000073 [Kwoniella sp. CBS 6097]